MNSQSKIKLFFLLSLVPAWLASAPLLADECGANYRCQEALVKFSRRLGPADIDRLLAENHATVVRRFPLTRLYLLSFPETYETSGWITAFRKQPGVLVAEANDYVWAQALPDDPSFNLLWGLKNSGQTGGLTGTDIGIEGVWDSLHDGNGVVVAVIDTGVDHQHPDLAANMWVNSGEIPANGIDDDGNGFVDDIHGYDFANNDGDPMDDHQHGTHVAGILGAVGNNGVGVSGVVWTAKIMALKFLNENAGGSAGDAVLAMEYAMANGAVILNNSWGSNSFNAALQNAILEADSQGVLFFAAAGNQGRDIDASPFYPASYDLPNIVSVASIDDGDELSSFSNFGALDVDLGAPGGEIFSTKPGNTYGYISGTSMATPYVAGVAALLWSEFPGLSHRQIRNLILQGVEPKAYLAGQTVMGGLLNADNSLAFALDPSNQVPEANAGSDRSLELGQAVVLNGAGSDGDGDFPLSFDWELIVPSGSRSRLDSYFSQNPSFVPDREGDYIATLVVSDSLSDSIPDTVTVTVAGGSLPLPEVLIRAFYRERGVRRDLSAGAPAPAGVAVELDGGESSSLFPDPLLFQWEVVAKPEGSQATLSSSDRTTSSLIPDRPGTYTVRLRVEDGYQENFAELSFATTEAAGPSDPNPLNPASPTSPGGGGCSFQVYR
ncbi:MAG TPA: S8 family serine peptidase [bacterium]|nr:S8 family serine peptidase [bacterium]